MKPADPRKDEVEDWLREIQNTYGPRAAIAIRRKYPYVGDQFIDEVLADALVRAYQRRCTYRTYMGSFSNWFNAIAVNEAKSQWRLQRKRKEEALPDDLAVISDCMAWYHDGDEEVGQGHAQKLKELQHAMSKLKPRDREILDRSIVRGNDSPSIGRELSMKPGAVRVTLFRALRRLRVLMLGDQVSDVPEDDE
jgi:RNA polymerase sigma factor (sigma-70 family)